MVDLHYEFDRTLLGQPVLLLCNCRFRIRQESQIQCVMLRCVVFSNQSRLVANAVQVLAHVSMTDVTAGFARRKPGDIQKLRLVLVALTNARDGAQPPGPPLRYSGVTTNAPRNTAIHKSFSLDASKLSTLKSVASTSHVTH